MSAQHRAGTRRLFVLSAPSGSGKTTIAREILRRHPAISFSVSATTRAKRPNEADGTDYFFMTKEEFKKKIDEEMLAEWEEIYGEYYGTLKSEIERALSAGKPMIFDVDVKGALSIQRLYPEASFLIFIMPPSIEALTKRLTERRTEDDETLTKRLARATMELEARSNFDIAVVNDDLHRAVEEVDAAIRIRLEEQEI